MRVASSSGNAVLRSFDGDDLSGYILRGGAVTPTLAKAGFAFSPDSNATGGELWSNDFHVYELIWQRDRITLKVDGNRYALGATPIVAANQPVIIIRFQTYCFMNNNDCFYLFYIILDVRQFGPCCWWSERIPRQKSY